MSVTKKEIINFTLKELGFDDCRFTSADAGDQLSFYKKWLDKSCNADMKYLENHLKFKQDPDLLLNNVKSAIIVIKNYKNTRKKKLDGNLKIARYAAGKDYHSVIMDRLKQLSEFIEKQNPDAHCYCGVDSRPIPERALALNSGIGFLGKNTMVIHPKLGSYFFIGVILTTQKFKSDAPLKKNCGKCRLCLDACPNNAINDYYQVDSKKCISYLTIEKKTPLSKQQREKTHGWIFGCDICQEACPYNNSRVPLTNWKEFHPKSGFGFNMKEDLTEISIPKDSAMYRSRKNIRQNYGILNKK